MDEHGHRVQRLWDSLAEIPAARSDDAFDFLLRSLCEMFDAANAGWIAAVRLPDAAGNDPAGGWRPRDAGYLRLTDDIAAARAEQYQRLEAGEVDPNIVENIRRSGQWRANRLTDLVEADWFESEYYRRFYAATGRADAIWAGCPVNEEVELYVNVYRQVDQPPFDEVERDRFLESLRGLKWLFRQHLFSHGLSVAEAPLTPAEREVLQALLFGDTKEEIAARTGRSPHTVHHHCKAIYQKFGVNNRASLMALWLGRPMCGA